MFLCDTTLWNAGNFLLQILKGHLYLKEWSASGLKGGGAINRGKTIFKRTWQWTGFFDFFCINRFGIGSLQNLSSRVRFWLRTLGDISHRKSTSRLSTIRGDADSPCRWVGELVFDKDSSNISVIFASSMFGVGVFIFFLLSPDFFIPEKDGEHWEPSIYKGRDGRRDKRCFLSYCLTSTCQRGGPTGKVNLITDST